MNTAIVRVDQFELNRLIGQGAMADVWEAVHVSGQLVALKIVTARNKQRQKTLQAFRNEARVAARLDHPNIIKLMDMGLVSEQTSLASQGRFQAGSPYLVMELASSFTLQDMMPCRDYKQLKHVTLQILNALSYAHANGVTHRDLKPSNVLIDHSQQHHTIKLGDFGIAQATFRRKDASLKDRRLQGTPSYMAPEQIKGLWRQQGPWTDLYSLGCMIFKMSSGQILYQGKLKDVLHAHLHQPLPQLKPLFEVPQGFEQWLSCLLQKDSEARCRLAADAAHALKLLEMPHQINTSASQTPCTQKNNITPPIPEHWQEKQQLASSILPAAVGLGLFGLRRFHTVAREDIRDQLWHSLMLVHQHKTPQVVLLRGQTGMGKTHLGKWLCRRAMETGAAIGIHVQHHAEHSAQDGLIEAVARVLKLIGLAASDLSKTLKDGLSRRNLQGVELEHIVQVLTHTITSPQQTTQTPHMDEVFNDKTKEQAIMAVIKVMAQERPIILHLDNVHQGTETIHLIRHLLNGEYQMPILVVGSIQDDASSTSLAYATHGNWITQHARSHTIQVEPMKDEQIRQMVSAHLGLVPDLLEGVVRQSKGQPLFTSQLLKNLVARDALTQDTVGYALKDNLQMLIPDDVEQLWQTRIEQILSSLCDSAKHEAMIALELAAVMGRDFLLKTWKIAAYQCAVALPLSLVEHLTTTGLIKQSNNTLSLTHNVLAQVLKAQIKRHHHWKQRHKACAQAIENTENPWCNNFDERLAHHWLQAGEILPALDYLARAIERHMTRGNLNKVRRCITQHIDILNRFEDDQYSHARAFSALYQGILAFEEGHHDQSNRYLETSKVLAQAHNFPKILGQIYLQQAAIAHNTQNQALTQLHIEDAFEAASTASDTPLQLKALTQMAQLNLYEGRAFEALAPLKIILRLCEDAPELIATQIMALIEIGEAYGQLKMNEQAAQSIDHALGLSQQLGIRKLTARALQCRGTYLRESGTTLDAIKDYKQALALFEYADAQRICVPIHIGLALAYIDLHEIPNAKQHLQLARHITERQRIVYNTHILDLGTLICYIAEGQLTRCASLLEKIDASITTNPAFARELKMLLATAIALAEDMVLTWVQEDLERLQQRAFGTRE